MHREVLKIPGIDQLNENLSISVICPDSRTDQDFVRLVMVCWGSSIDSGDSLIANLVNNLGFSCLELQLWNSENGSSYIDDKTTGVGASSRSTISVIDQAYKQLTSTGRYILAGLIGSTEGAYSLFQWALSVQDQVIIPTIINLSGCSDKLNSLPVLNADQSELAHTLKELDKQIGVLSIYGINDPNVAQSAIFANSLAGRHKLVLVPETDGSLSQSKLDIVSIISGWFDAENERERFTQCHQHSGVITRWKDIEGVQNFRDFGGFKTKNSRINIRPGLLFRSAALSGITEKGKSDLALLGIKTVFDLRSDHEAEKKPCPVIPGVTIKRVPVYKNMDLDPEALARRYSNYGDPKQGFQRAYREIIVKGGPGPYRQILEHIRDHPDDAILIHCTAGKDRTGVICAIILLLLEVDKDTVAREYELTTYGLRNEIQNILEALAAEKDHWEKEGDKFARMLSSTYDTMLGFIHVLDTEFGGAENYIRRHTGLDDKDISRIKHNLIAENGRGWKWIHSQL